MLSAPHPLDDDSAPRDRRPALPSPLSAFESQAEPRRNRDEHLGYRTSLAVLCDLSWVLALSVLQPLQVSKDEHIKSRTGFLLSTGLPRKDAPPAPRGERGAGILEGKEPSAPTRSLQTLRCPRDPAPPAPPLGPPA